MGEFLVRAWRVVRHPSAAKGGLVAAARADRYAPPPPRRSARDRHCGASGWQVRTACGDGAGGTICPVCSQRVRTQRGRSTHPGIEVIQAHLA